MMRSTIAFMCFLFLVALAAFSGASFEPGAWYEALEKPLLNPPDWIFAPVWTLLYLGITVAGWLVWRTGQAVAVPLALWAAQLGLNALWSYLFFGINRVGPALVDIVVLLVLVAATAASFMKRSKVAGALMVPYAAWVAFATYLNAGIWLLNR